MRSYQEQQDEEYNFSELINEIGGINPCVLSRKEKNRQLDHEIS